MKRVEISDNRGDFTLSEALISINTIKKLQKEVAALQEVCSEMQFYVQKHQLSIN